MAKESTSQEKFKWMKSVMRQEKMSQSRHRMKIFNSHNRHSLPLILTVRVLEARMGCENKFKVCRSKDNHKRKS